MALTEVGAVKLKNLSFLRGFCTRDRGRTDTTVKLLVFETSLPAHAQAGASAGGRVYKLFKNICLMRPLPSPVL